MTFYQFFKALHSPLNYSPTILFSVTGCSCSACQLQQSWPCCGVPVERDPTLSTCHWWGTKAKNRSTRCCSSQGSYWNTGWLLIQLWDSILNCCWLDIGFLWRGGTEDRIGEICEKKNVWKILSLLQFWNFWPLSCFMMCHWCKNQQNNTIIVIIVG